MARAAGFDAVQIHAAHGYLVHQFLSPWTNRRRDLWSEPNRFLLRVIDAVHRYAGDDFPIWVKLSWSEDRRPGIDLAATSATVRGPRRRPGRCDRDQYRYNGVAHEYLPWRLSFHGRHAGQSVVVALSELDSVHLARHRRPDAISAVCDRFRKITTRRPQPNCNGRVPTQIIPVGGIRHLDGMAHCLEELHLPAVALCRPLIRDPRLPNRLIHGEAAGVGLYEL